jgi:hypothetical protein
MPSNQTGSGLNVPPLDMSQLMATPEPVIDTKEEELQAKFAASKGWIDQKQYLQDRIEYWQHYLPGNTPVNQMTPEQRDIAWTVADNVIREINLWVTQVDTTKNAYSNTNNP